MASKNTISGLMASVVGAGLIISGLGAMSAGRRPAASFEAASQVKAPVDEAAIQNFIAQFPPNLQEILATYRKTKTGNAAVKMMAESNVTIFLEDNPDYGMSNGFDVDRRLILKLQKSFLEISPSDAKESAYFMMRLTNEVSTLYAAKDVFSLYLDKILAGDVAGAMEHIIKVEMASDMMMLSMGQELVEAGLADIGTINSFLDTQIALVPKEALLTPKEVASKSFKPEAQNRILNVIWHGFPFMENERALIYLYNHGNEVVDLSLRSTMTQASIGYDPSQSSRRSVQAEDLYDRLSGQKGFSQKMAGPIGIMRQVIHGQMAPQLQAVILEERATLAAAEKAGLSRSPTASAKP